MLKGIVLVAYFSAWIFLIGLDSVHELPLMVFPLIIGLLINKRVRFSLEESHSLPALILILISFAFLKEVQFTNVQILAIIISVAYWYIASPVIADVKSFMFGAAIGIFLALVVAFKFSEFHSLLFSLVIFIAVAAWHIFKFKAKTSLPLFAIAVLLVGYVSLGGLHIQKSAPSLLAMSFADNIFEVVGGEKVEFHDLRSSDKEFKTMLKKTLESYPHTSLWLVGSGGILLSAKRPVNINYKKMKEAVLGTEKIKSDLRERFNATEFNEILLVDSFTFLYFMSEEELYEYSNEPPSGKNALTSIFDFKIRGSGLGFAVSVPVFVNLSTKIDGRLFLETENIEIKLDEGWVESKTLIVTYFDYIEETQQYGTSYQKRHVFLKNTTTISVQSYGSEIVRVLEESEAAEVLLDEEVRRAGVNSIITEREFQITDISEDTVDGYPAHVFYGGREGHEASALSVAWYCRAQKRIFVVAIDYFVEPDLTSILTGISCNL